MEWLREAVDAVAEVDPQVAAAGHWGKVALLNACHTRLSVALQKGNAACLLQAGRVRSATDFTGGSGWEDGVEDLLRDAAAVGLRLDNMLKEENRNAPSSPSSPARRRPRRGREGRLRV